MIEVRTLAPKIGAEILHVDARKLDDAAFKVIYQAFLDHVLVLVRAQQLTESEFPEWSARFGELKPHIAKTAHHAQKIEKLSGTYVYGGRLKRQQERLQEADRNRKPAVHPLVQIHPETGRKTLYFNDGQIVGIAGLAAEESDAIFAELRAHTASADGDYRHKWQAGDLVIWDNRCSIHCATGDYPVNERRKMWRTTIMEDGWQRREVLSA